MKMNQPSEEQVRQLVENFDSIYRLTHGFTSGMEHNIQIIADYEGKEYAIELMKTVEQLQTAVNQVANLLEGVLPMEKID